MTKPRALIIGGSVGGLFAAHLLNSIDWDVEVFERVDDDLASRGAGIGTHPVLREIMRRLGLSIDNSIAVATSSYICRDRTGRLILELPTSRMMSAWAPLYRGLRDNLRRARYHRGKDCLEVRFSGGSVTRRLCRRLAGNGRPAESGPTACAPRCAASFSRTSSPPTPGTSPGVRWCQSETWHPRRARCSSASISSACRRASWRCATWCRRATAARAWATATTIWCGTGPRTRPHSQTSAPTRRGASTVAAIPPPLIRPEVIADLRQFARAELSPPLFDVVDRTEQPFFQSIHDLASPRVVFGRVAMLGDAAFVARPHVGAGVTKAALDALCLVEAISAAGAISTRRSRATIVRGAASAIGSSAAGATSVPRSAYGRGRRVRSAKWNWTAVRRRRWAATPPMPRSLPG